MSVYRDQVSPGLLPLLFSFHTLSLAWNSDGTKQLPSLCEEMAIRNVLDPHRAREPSFSGALGQTARRSSPPNPASSLRTPGWTGSFATQLHPLPSHASSRPALPAPQPAGVRPIQRALRKKRVMLDLTHQFFYLPISYLPAPTRGYMNRFSLKALTCPLTRHRIKTLARGLGLYL